VITIKGTPCTLVSWRCLVKCYDVTSAPLLLCARPQVTCQSYSLSPRPVPYGSILRKQHTKLRKYYRSTGLFLSLIRHSQIYRPDHRIVLTLVIRVLQWTTGKNVIVPIISCSFHTESLHRSTVIHNSPLGTFRNHRFAFYELERGSLM
jgi:hypothetical protein